MSEAPESSCCQEDGYACGPFQDQEAEIGRLTAALMRLANEVRATMSQAEQAVREAAGNTNYQCLMDAESEARVALGAHQQNVAGGKNE